MKILVIVDMQNDFTSGVLGNRDEFYKRVRYQTRKFKSYWWPIPQDEIDKNPNLKQMPGWMN